MNSSTNTTGKQTIKSTTSFNMVRKKFLQGEYNVSRAREKTLSGERKKYLVQEKIISRAREKNNHRSDVTF